jgi:hypothetical protein
MQPRRNTWAVRDEAGLVHTAMVVRFFDEDEGFVTMFEVSTACHPRVTRVNGTVNQHWVGCYLPRTMIPAVPVGHQPRFIINEWNVREVPTCLGCAAYGGFQ